MELTTDIFQIVNLERSDEKILATLSINDQSEIFKGHFPNQPVVPGACMLQLVKDILEAAFEKPLQLLKAEQLKFITMLVPGNEQELTLDISYKILEDGNIKTTAKLIAGDLVCFKFQGIFLPMINDNLAK
jgi:3-hydroxyacyl-[acyl-carrier-protein] dehydratase